MSSTRVELHRLAAHILGRRRYDVTGHFGLRASPGGIATPAFGPEPEVLRIAGASLIREVGAGATDLALDGSSLDDVAAFAGVDLRSEFSAGHDTPPLGATHKPLRVDAAGLAALAAWFDLAWRALDACITQLGPDWTSSTIQLWPEHFDAGTTLSGPEIPSSVNLGFSAGDAFNEEPYVYIGPWGPERPGDEQFWNAPFGAFVTRQQTDDVPSALAFLLTGIELLSEV